MNAGDMRLHDRLVDKLGEGGMGVVWRAVDTSLEREVALKLLPAAFAQDSEAILVLTRGRESDIWLLKFDETAFRPDSR